MKEENKINDAKDINKTTVIGTHLIMYQVSSNSDVNFIYTAGYTRKITTAHQGLHYFGCSVYIKY